MHLGPKAETKIWPAQKGTQFKNHLAVDAHGLPVRIMITEGTRADCTQAHALIKGISAGHLLADRGYDTDAIFERALQAQINPVIPPKCNRKNNRDYDRYLYTLRHLVENAFLYLKRWRGIATRYAKKLSLIPRCCPDSMTFSVGSYLVTTLCSPFDFALVGTECHLVMLSILFFRYNFFPLSSDNLYAIF